MKRGKIFRNQSRFSRKRAVSAMQPGYIEEKVMPVSSWKLRGLGGEGSVGEGRDETCEAAR